MKLVRDRMEITVGRVQSANTPAGKHMALVLKLHEEAEEIGRDATNPSEYADLLEVLQELARINGVSWQGIQDAKLAKFKERGGFRLGRVWFLDEPRAVSWPNPVNTGGGSSPEGMG